MGKIATTANEAEKAKEAAEDEAAARQAIIDAAPSETCPILGLQHLLGARLTTREEQLHGAPPMAPALQVQFIPCILHKCAFYNGSGCIIRNGLEGMARMANADALRRAAGQAVKP